MKISKENKYFLKRVQILALPIVIQDLINASVNIVDTVMIGTLGVENITAVGLANQIFFLYILFIFGISSGASILMGQYWGDNDRKIIHATMGISFISGLIISIIFTLLAFTMPEKLLGLYNDDPNVILIGSKYLRIVCFTYPIVALALVINFSHRSTAQTKLPMITTFLALACNVILTAIFIFKFNMGAEGAAYGTLIARSVEVIAQLFFTFKYKSPILGKFKNYLSADLAFVKKYYKSALPVILNEVIWAIGTTCYMVLYGKLSNGVNAQASVQISSQVRQLFTVVGLGIGSSAGIMLGNLLGSNEVEKAKEYSKKFIKLTVFVNIIFSTILIMSAPYILNLFNLEPDVRADVHKVLIVTAVFLNFALFNYLTIVGILRCGGDVTFCLILDGLAVWIVGVPLTALGVYLNLPIYLVVLLTNCEEIFKFILSLRRTLTYKWAKNIISDEAALKGA